MFLRYKFFYGTKPKKGETQEQAEIRQEAEEKKAMQRLEEGELIKNLRMELDDKTTKKIGLGQRQNTAKVVNENRPEIVALQEVENMTALKKFNGAKYTTKPYGYRMLVEGNDDRMINVCVFEQIPYCLCEEQHSCSRPRYEEGAIFTRLPGSWNRP